MLRRQIPTEKHCNADNSAQDESTDQWGSVIPGTTSVMTWCVEKCHRPSSFFESEILVSQTPDKFGMFRAALQLLGKRWIVDAGNNRGPFLVGRFRSKPEEAPKLSGQYEVSVNAALFHGMVKPISGTDGDDPREPYRYALVTDTISLRSSPSARSPVV
jgi:hypothetical protein